MIKTKYLILGAGPAGLTLANMLKRNGERSYLLLEKEKEAGGLCRSVMVDGSPFDIGGGHFLDVKRPKVCAFLFDYMPENEWQLFERDSRIDINGKRIGHPLEANIWQFGKEEQEAYLASISRAGCNNGIPAPEKFVDWILWKLGDRIANDYMLPYNQKMFADELDQLGTYWLEKLPNVSFEETLASCREHRPYGSQPGHAFFYYPKKYGYGELWRRMAQEIAPDVYYQMEVTGIDCWERKVYTASGEVFAADTIITTIPWRTYRDISGMPKEMTLSVKKLKSSAIETRYVPQNLDTGAQWIYVPDLKKPYHRLLVRHNFCGKSRGYWMETRQERTRMFSPDDIGYRYVNTYAYPLNTVEKPEIMRKLLHFCSSRNIYATGRWGEHSHLNSDVVVEKAAACAEAFVQGGKYEKI